MGPLLFLTIALLANDAAQPSWILQESESKARFRGISVARGEVAWASGTQGTVARTTDGGRSWRAGTVPGASGLDFRDIHAVDANTAYVLAIGAGELSRIYKTVDGGGSWKLLFTNRDPRVFLDAIAFWDAERGIVQGDPVDGRFVILTTDDGGATWTRGPAESLPPALPGEGAFAASGTCLVTHGSDHVWFGTGGARISRVFRSTDRGRSWSAHEAPIRAGTPSSGIFSLAFHDAQRGVAVGGDYTRPAEAGRNIARTEDGGRLWELIDSDQLVAYRSAVAFVPGAPSPTLVTVGPSGSNLSVDGGKHWTALGTLGFNAIGFAERAGAGWAVGDNGRIARFAGEVRDRP